MTEPIDDDRALVEAARAALERSELTHLSAASIPEAPPEWTADHTILAAHAAEHGGRLGYFDPDRRMGPSGFEALSQAEEALRREAASWRALVNEARDPWRAEFDVAAREAERTADGIRALRHRLHDRDRASDIVSQGREAER